MELILFDFQNRIMQEDGKKCPNKDKRNMMTLLLHR